MAGIGQKDTKPELQLRRALHRLGLRYRLGGAGLPGRPDILFPKHRVALFVHGCFWHRHEGCRVAAMPKSNVGFWTEKFARNVARDAKVANDLEGLGWRVLIAWECEVTSRKSLHASALRLRDWITGDKAVPTD